MGLRGVLGVGLAMGLALAGPSRAEPDPSPPDFIRPGWYIQAGGNFSVLNAGSLENGSELGAVTSKGFGPGANVRVGKRFNQNVAVEVQGEWIRHQTVPKGTDLFRLPTDDRRFARLSLQESCLVGLDCKLKFPVDGDPRIEVNSLAVTLNIRAYPSWPENGFAGGRIQPYLIGGAGFGLNTTRANAIRADVAESDATAPPPKTGVGSEGIPFRGQGQALVKFENTDFDIALKAGVGVDFYLTENVLLTVDGTILWLNRIGSVPIDLSVGAAYRF